MPEYLAPGVYVEETSFRSKSIEGVSTTTTGFIGPTRFGPIDLEPEIITSLGEFERTYGDRQQLQFEPQSKPMNNWMWHAVRGFFEEGGKRLYVVRVYAANPTDALGGFAGAAVPEQTLPTLAKDERMETRLPDALHFRARFPGKPGDTRVRLTLRIGQSVLGSETIRRADDTRMEKPTVRSLQPNDLVWINDDTSPIESPPGSGEFYIAEKVTDPRSKEETWQFRNDALGTPRPLSSRYALL